MRELVQPALNAAREGVRVTAYQAELGRMVAAREFHHETQIGYDHALSGTFIALMGLARQFLFLIGIEE